MSSKTILFATLDKIRIFSPSRRRVKEKWEGRKKEKALLKIYMDFESSVYVQ
jgi:hypothetical protein